jgi:nitrate/TMAO reductase-like tetraheme cytochrome c subunit
MKRLSALKLMVGLLSVTLGVSAAIQGRDAAGLQSGSESQPRHSAQAQQAPAPGQQSQPAAESLQLLKGMDRQKILGEMRKVASSLGVECNFCHVRPFEADTPRKSVARLMMRDYTMGMKHKDGSALACNDCHKGQPNFLRTRPYEGAIARKTSGLQVLKGVPRERLTQIMTAFTKALGVECTYCHTADFDEDTPRKLIARYMMTEYSQGLVKADGSAVGCNDCHQGHALPLSVLSFPRQQQQPGRRPNG